MFLEGWGVEVSWSPAVKWNSSKLSQNEYCQRRDQCTHHEIAALVASPAFSKWAVQKQQRRPEEAWLTPTEALLAFLTVTVVCVALMGSAPGVASSGKVCC